jgi:uncharacterized protein
LNAQYSASTYIGRVPRIQFFDDEIDAYVCEALPSTTSQADPSFLTPSYILSTFLGRPVHLVLKGPQKRPMIPTNTHPVLPGEVVLQDGYPLHILTEESLLAVQDRVKRSANGEEGWKAGKVDETKWKEAPLVMER